MIDGTNGVLFGIMLMCTPPGTHYPMCIENHQNLTALNPDGYLTLRACDEIYAKNSAEIDYKMGVKHVVIVRAYCQWEENGPSYNITTKATPW